MIKEKLEQKIYEEFGKVIKRIYLPEGANILKYKVNEKQGIVGIKITQLELPVKGKFKIMDDRDIASNDYGCPHKYLLNICGFKNSEMQKFRKKYSINYIEGPDNECENGCYKK